MFFGDTVYLRHNELCHRRSDHIPDTFRQTPPQTPLEPYITVLPRPPSCIRGPTSDGRYEKEEEGRGGEGGTNVEPHHLLLSNLTTTVKSHYLTYISNTTNCYPFLSSLPFHSAPLLRYSLPRVFLSFFPFFPELYNMRAIKHSSIITQSRNCAVPRSAVAAA